MLFSSSSLTTVATLRLVIGHRVVPIGPSHLWLLRVRTHHFSSTSVHLSLLVGARSGIGAAFCLHIIQVKALGQVVQSLLRKGAFELVPLSSLGYYSRLFYIKKALGSWRPILILSLLCARYIILKEVYLLFPMHPYSGYFLWVMAFGKIFQFLALCLGLFKAPQVFTRVMAPVRSFLHSLGFGFGLICTTGSFRRPPESRFSFSEDVPLVVQFSRHSHRLGEVSACGASVVISSSESYWTLLFSGLLQPGNESTSFSQLAPCFYHEWIYLHLLARVDEDAVLSDSAHSRGMAAVIPVALHRPWVRIDSEALVRWSSEILQDLFWWWAHERLELVSSLGWVSPQLTWGPPLPMSVGLSSQPFLVFRVDPGSISVSAASVKVVGVTRPVHNHTVSPLLALFFSFPRSQRS